MKITIDYQCRWDDHSLTDRFEYESRYIDCVSGLERALHLLRNHVEQRTGTNAVVFNAIDINIPGWSQAKSR